MGKTPKDSKQVWPMIQVDAFDAQKAENTRENMDNYS
jgi:hypothetical protein